MNRRQWNPGRAALGALLASLAPVALAFDTTVPCDANRVTALIGLVASANATAGTDTIRLVDDCVFTFTAPNGNAADGSPAALVVSDALNLVGNGAILERSFAGGTPAFRLIAVAAGDSLTINGVTLRNGFSLGDSGQSGMPPGGAYTLGGAFAGRGGAILGEGILVGINLRFEANRAQGGAGGNGYGGSAGGGGGAGMGGAVYVAGNGASLSRCVFVDNVAAGGAGGSIGGGSPGSQAGAGGGPGGRGGYFDGTQRAGEPGGFGGGGGGSWITVPTGTVYGGAGDIFGIGGGGGGGLGGAVFVAANLTVLTSTFSDNVALGAAGGFGGGGGSGAGGAAFVRAGTLTLRYVTVAGGAVVGGNAGGGGNQASGGNATGGNILADGGSVALETSIVTGGALGAGAGANNGPAGLTSNPDIAGAIQSMGYNLVGSRGTSSGYVASDLADGTDPMLEPLADNGGDTLTHALAAGSPAIDAVPAGGSCSASIDQRGSQRPSGPACDIGAFELVDVILANGFED